MRPTVGIICEYDPFHRGHARQFALVREQLPDARIVCVMSGCFTQRGSPALFSPAFRARAALAAGASMVLELPCAFALREAENFALGGVAVLHGLGFVSHISFGCENAMPDFLGTVAALMENPNAPYQAALRAALDGGAPFVAAQAEAVAAGLADDGVLEATPRGLYVPPTRDAVLQALGQPNNILAICYLRALIRLQSRIIPLPVQRVGDYHATHLAVHGYPSASAVRRAYLAGDIASAESACGYALAGEPCHRPDALDTLLLHTLRNQTPDALRALPDCTEGLENRLLKAAREAVSRAELLALLKTKRYAHARLNRLLGHALLGVTGELLSQNPLPTYARLLGFRKDDRACLSLLNESRLPIVAKAADGDLRDPLLKLDARAYDLWALGAGLPAGLMFTQEVVVV